MTRRRLTKTVVLVLKLGVSVGLLTWLVRQALADESFARLSESPKEWRLLLLAWALCLLGVTTAIVRWYLLVVPLGLVFRLRDAFRLGFIGYLFNFFSLGSVGGDLFKAVFIAREQPTRRAEAVATVFFDRLVGLFGLFLIALGSVLFGGLRSHQQGEIRVLADVVLLAVFGAACFVGLLLVPGFTGGRISGLLRRVPMAGPILARLLGAMRIYRQRLPIVALALLLSLVLHSVFVVAFHLIARGLLPAAPSLAESFVVVPISFLASLLPLPFAGLGALEAALDYLYRYVPSGVAMLAGEGLVVALCYRIISMTLSTAGVVYWLRSHGEVSEMLRRAGAADEHELA